MTTTELEHSEAGTPYPAVSAGTIHPGFRVFRHDQRPLVAFDWSAGALDCTYDGETVFQVKKIEELAAMLKQPYKLVCEASFESFVPGRRHAMAQMLRDAGHEIYVFRSTATERHRRAADIEKSNENDARTIYRIAAETDTHIYPLLDSDPDWTARREALNSEYFIIKMSKQKNDQLIDPAKAILGKFKDLSPVDKVRFGNAKNDGYSDTMLSAVYFATLHTTNRYDFERLLGLWQSACPSLLRSEIHHHSWRHIRKGKPDMTAFRRTVRNLRSVLIAAGVGANDETVATVET